MGTEAGAVRLTERMAAGVYLTTANAARVPWPDVDEHIKVFQRKLMAAALKAAREPTEAQIVAGTGWVADRSMVSQMWRAMIDAELGG